MIEKSTFDKPREELAEHDIHDMELVAALCALEAHLSELSSRVTSAEACKCHALRALCRIAHPFCRSVPFMVTRIHMLLRFMILCCCSALLHLFGRDEYGHRPQVCCIN